MWTRVSEWKSLQPVDRLDYNARLCLRATPSPLTSGQWAASWLRCCPTGPSSLVNTTWTSSTTSWVSFTQFYNTLTLFVEPSVVFVFAGRSATFASSLIFVWLFFKAFLHAVHIHFLEFFT